MFVKLIDQAEGLERYVSVYAIQEITDHPMDVTQPDGPWTAVMWADRYHRVRGTAVKLREEVEAMCRSGHHAT
ncbi:MAG: hypothetical protein V2A71_06255 [Candidatus Eisenbacteria bacterium]